MATVFDEKGININAVRDLYRRAHAVAKHKVNAKKKTDFGADEVSVELKAELLPFLMKINLKDPKNYDRLKKLIGKWRPKIDETDLNIDEADLESDEVDLEIDREDDAETDEGNQVVDGLHQKLQYLKCREEYRCFIVRELLLQLLPICRNEQLCKEYNKYHFYEVKANQFSGIGINFLGQRGDYLKKNILDDFKQQIEATSDVDELLELVEKLQKTEEYKVIATGQGVVTRGLSLETSSVKAFKKMINDQKACLGYEDGISLKPR